MRLAKDLADLLIFSNFALAQIVLFTTELTINDKTHARDDVTVKISVKGGKKPYKYVWNNSNISIYNSSYKNWSEGDSVKVTVIDANFDSVSVNGYVAPNSFSEHINNAMKPAVKHMQD